MLPLWIIDLRKKSERRTHFEELLGKINHIFLNNANASGSNDSDALSVADVIDSSESNSEVYAQNPAQEGDFEQSLQEQLDITDKKDAEKNSILEGNYWRYSPMEGIFYGIDIDNKIQKENAKYSTKNANIIEAEYGADHIRSEVEKSPTAEGTAERLYKFQCDLVKEGQAFINDLRCSNVHPDLTINIVVLGDLTEDFTRILFPAIAGLIQKEKGRILPHHIHQGMEIIGMLYIPSDINAREVNLRKSMQRTLNEIDVQHRVDDIRGYDHMMFYQDVQNRTDCAYSKLNDQQLAQYLLQCLVHMYLACNNTHPLLNGFSSADAFYFSMGASSVHYNIENEKLKKCQKFAIDFFRNFKSEGDDEKENLKFELIDEESYSPKRFFEDFGVLNKLKCDDIEDESPTPHPIRNFMEKHLKRLYYNTYLRFFTVNAMRDVTSQIENCTRASLETISVKSKKRFADAQKIIFGKLNDLLNQISANDGGLPTIVRLFKEMQESLSAKKQEIQRILEQNFWNNIIDNFIEKKNVDKFIEYHDAYVHDIKDKNGGKNQLEMKKQAVTDLNGILSKESTMLANICRTLLLSIVSALAFVPILNSIFDWAENLYDLWYLYIGIFLIPALIKFIAYLRYTRKKKRAISNLKVMYLHDAYARVANRIESEINSFYNKMIALGDRYLDRCENIRTELGKEYKSDELKAAIFPETMFNQPLIGGKFGRERLLPGEENDGTKVKINNIHYNYNDISKVEFFLFINENHHLIKDLFRDVALCENLIRRINDNGEEELVTKEQQELEQLTAWEAHKKTFYEELKKAINSTIIQSEHSSVGEKLYQYCIATKTNNTNILKPMIAYSATNGEITSTADIEYIDIKMNEKRVEEILKPLIPSINNQIQVDKYDYVYNKYLFITRWRRFEHLNLNRILPMEDFDDKIRKQLVYDAEMEDKAEKEKAKRKNKKQILQSTDEASTQPDTNEKKKQYVPRPSSLLLWALCPDDSSSEWFRLFDSDFFTESYNDKTIYREILNQND